MLRQTTKKISASVIAGIIAFLSVAICFLYAGSVSVSALSAFPMKTYIIGTSNIRTYSDTSLSNPIGWIYPTDEVIITKIYKKNGRYVGYGSYPTSRGSKFAFFDLSMITSDSNSMINNLKSESREATGNYTTYRRPGSSLKAGSIDRGDIVFYCNTKDGYVQVLYNIGSASNPSGMRLAWITVDNYNRCVGNSKGITVFSQTDNRWSSHGYGYSDPAATKRATIGSSGCGLLSLTNAVYYLNGQFINPTTLADYSLRYGYRVNGTGTSGGLYKSFADNRGSSYNIAYNGSSDSYSTLRSHLQAGEVAVGSAPGHLMAVVAYDSSSGKFLILDSSKNVSRDTASTGYTWKTESQCRNNSKLKFSSFYFIKKR